MNFTDEHKRLYQDAGRTEADRPGLYEPLFNGLKLDRVPDQHREFLRQAAVSHFLGFAMRRKELAS